jgi:hypothetical protein
VTAVGGMASSCDNFIRMVESTLAESQDDLKSYNRNEQRRFRRPK